jgi:hypothetical protein
MAKDNRKTYDVNFRVVLIVSTEVKADNLIDAIEAANDVKDSSLFTVNGEYNDGSRQLISVGRNAVWNTEEI